MTVAAPSRRRILGSLAATLVPLPVSAQTAKAGPEGFRILEARKTGLKLLPAGPTAGFGYDGAVPGPQLRFKLGEEVRLRLVNSLDQPTTLHWQGLRGQNAVDGVGGLTQTPVAPGASFDYRFTPPDAGIILYKPSLRPHNVEQIARGLSGALIVEEADPPEVDRDLLVTLQDWKLDAQGRLEPPFGEPGAGRVGGALTANLAAAPLTEFAPPGARVRLRFVNACVARIAIAVFEGGAPQCISIDGQACDPFNLVRNTAPVAPGARFEFVYDMPAQEGAELKIGLWNGRDKPRLPLFALKAKGKPTKPRAPFAGLPANPKLPPEIRLGDAKKLELAIEPPKAPGGSWTINGAPGGYNGKPLFSIKRGTPVSMGFSNKSDVALSMHVHGVSMRLLHDLDDGWEPYWRNSAIVPKRMRKHVAFVADAPGKWAVHCDIADHEAAGLATWFEVV